MNYLQEIANAITREVSSDALPDRDTSDLFLVYAVLLLARGQGVSREDVHNAWVAWMTSHGEELPTMVPFGELPAEEQAEDSPFVSAIRAVAGRLAQ